MLWRQWTGDVRWWVGGLRVQGWVRAPGATSLLNGSPMPRSVKSHNTYFHSRAREAGSPPRRHPLCASPAVGQAIEHVKTGKNKQHYHNAAVAHLKSSCQLSLGALSSLFVFFCLFLFFFSFKLIWSLRRPCTRDHRRSVEISSPTCTVSKLLSLWQQDKEVCILQ